MLGTDVAGLVDDVLCPVTRQEMLDAAKRYSKAIDDMHASALAKKPAKETRGPKAKKKKLGEKDLQFVEMSRKYLPLVEGCTLTNEVTWHTRFKIEYPTWLPPHGTSASYQDTDPASKRTAMLSCVSWEWTHQERQTHQSCPFELGS